MMNQERFVVESVTETWDGSNWINESRILTTIVEPGIVAVEDEQPLAFHLYPAYPNPFNPSTTLTYSLALLEHVTLRVYDMLGRAVATLVDQRKAPGRYQVRFDASGLPSGVFLYQLRVGSRVESGKTVLMK